MEQRQIFLRDVLTVLFKRKGLIVAFLVLVTAVVFVGNYVWPPTYESTAKLQLVRGRETSSTDPTVMRSQAAMAMVQMSTHDVNTEMELIYSNDVLRTVAKEMKFEGGIPGPASPLPWLFSRVKNAGRSLQQALALKKAPEDPLQEVVETLRKAIKVEPVKDSFVLEIACHMGRADLAHDVLAKLIEAYKQKRQEVYTAQETEGFFKEQLARVERELAEAQRALEKYRNEHNIVSLDIENQILLQQYSEAKRLMIQLAETETAAQEAAGEGPVESEVIATLSRKTESTVVTELQLRLLELILERNRQMQSLGPQHPQIVGVGKEIRSATQRLKEAIAATREATERRMQDLESRVQALNRVMAGLDELERKLKVCTSNYEYYAQKVEEALVSSAMAKEGISNVKVTSSPSKPADPIRPRKLLNLVLAVIGGIVGGIALAFFFEYLDHGLKTPEDVEYYIQTPPLASFFRKAGDRLNPKEAQRLSTMMDAVAEQGAVHTALVVSSVRGEGAHRVARALAEARADDPATRTLYLDLGGGEEPSRGGGFLDVLMGEASLDSVMTHMGNMTVVERGSVTECPAYVWHSDRTRKLMAEVKQRFDRIVVHTPPILQSHDALGMARYVEGIVLVIRADATRREVVQRAIETLGESKQKVLGAVLTERKLVIPDLVYRRVLGRA